METGRITLADTAAYFLPNEEVKKKHIRGNNKRRTP